MIALSGLPFQLLMCTSVLFSRQLAMTVVFGSGKPQLEASGDPRVASELNSLKIHLMQTQSWTTMLWVNSGVVCEWSTTEMYKLSREKESTNYVVS